ncbi:MAG: DNA translocase FtsK, partial [Clostridia bacterium]|nr:DNA translocase FtsK [Clostridia bacterium]
MLLLHRGRPVVLRTVCILLVPFFVGALVHLFADGGIEAGEISFVKLVSALWSGGKVMKCGGVVAGFLAIGLEKLVSIYGAVPVFLFAIVLLLMIALRITPSMVVARIKARERREYIPEPLEEDNGAVSAKRGADAPVYAERSDKRHVRHAIDIPMDDDQAGAYEEKRVGFFNANPRKKTPDQVYQRDTASAAQSSAETPVQEPKPLKIGINLMNGQKPPVSTAAQQNLTADVKPLSVEEAADIAGVTIASPEDMIKTEEFSTEQVRAMRSAAKKTIAADELQDATEEVARAVEEKNTNVAPVYNYPPLQLLQQGTAAAVDGREEVAINSERLQATLDSFGVSANICDITRGPTVTRYDVELETGVKLSKLTNLAGDLALSLGVTGVRIAPIPDRISTVGIEVPNKIVSTVYLRDIVDSDAFSSAGSKLTFALGKDIGGNAIVGNIAKLPHLLIAGTTGSGKSVCMNCLILSLLYKSTPEEVRLIMIDPKMVELGIYNGIPHLYIPVVTDPKKAAGSLQWSVIEMLKRYRLFSECGVRDLAGYNALQKKNGEATLPQVVIVIDELADLMMTAAKEVEESICRVAQMGRAAGVHLVIATQRPSADVITGLMKANIPSRIAFAVSSAMESRIILDQAGAEKLVGSGDMLYAPLGVGKPTRIQGAFVTDEEREEVVNFIKRYGEANYDAEVQAAIEQAMAEKPAANAHAESVDEPAVGADYDELLPQAVEVIFETKQASVS